MKKTLKALLLIITGLIIGFVAGSFNSFRLATFFYSNSLLEIAVDVQQLQQGQSESVLERKMRGLPILVEQFDSHFRKFTSEDDWNSTMWAVSRCYENQEGAPPASIKHILDALPPRPLSSCEIKRRAAKEENENVTEPEPPADMNEPH